MRTYVYFLVVESEHSLRQAQSRPLRISYHIANSCQSTFTQTHPYHVALTSALDGTFKKRARIPLKTTKLPWSWVEERTNITKRVTCAHLVGNISWVRPTPTSIHLFLQVLRGQILLYCRCVQSKETVPEFTISEEFIDCYLRIGCWGFDQDILTRNMIHITESSEPYRFS